MSCVCKLIKYRIEVIQLKISDNGVNFIANFEGLRTTGYLCPASVKTIGIGETGKFALTGQKITVGMKITEKQAKDSFKIAIKRYEDAVNKLNVPMNQNQFDALVSFCYNLGVGIFKGSLLSSIKKQDWEDVARQMKLYCNARVNGKLTKLKGLVRRREAEAKLLLTPCNSTTSMQQEKDDDLFNAVSKIIKSGIKLDFNSWKRKDLISKNIKNVPILLDRLGGLDKLVKDGIISDKALWQQKKYNETHVRSLLIKYASKLK